MQKIANTIQITLTTNECRNCGSIADSWVKNPGKDTKVEETKQTEMSQEKAALLSSCKTTENKQHIYITKTDTQQSLRNNFTNARHKLMCAHITLRKSYKMQTFHWVIK